MANDNTMALPNASAAAFAVAPVSTTLSIRQGMRPAAVLLSDEIPFLDQRADVLFALPRTVIHALCLVRHLRKGDEYKTRGLVTNVGSGLRVHDDRG